MIAKPVPFLVFFFERMLIETTFSSSMIILLLWMSIIPITMNIIIPRQIGIANQLQLREKSPFSKGKNRNRPKSPIKKSEPM